MSSLGVDLLTLSAAKIYGPKQVGALWASDDVRLRPLVYGGGQEGGVRSGTENVAGVVGLARALELASERRAGEARRLAGAARAAARGPARAPAVDGGLRAAQPQEAPAWPSARGLRGGSRRAAS